MNVEQLLAFTREQLEQSGHPDIKAVNPLDVPGMGVDCTDGSRHFVRICHIGPANIKPTRPDWQAGARR